MKAPKIFNKVRKKEAAEVLNSFYRSEYKKGTKYFQSRKKEAAKIPNS